MAGAGVGTGIEIVSCGLVMFMSIDVTELLAFINCVSKSILMVETSTASMVLTMVCASRLDEAGILIV